MAEIAVSRAKRSESKRSTSADRTPLQSIKKQNWLENPSWMNRGIWGNSVEDLDRWANSAASINVEIGTIVKINNRE